MGWSGAVRLDTVDVEEEAIMERRCKTEVFSRVTGFFRPVQDWNRGKKEEFKDRKVFKVEVRR